MAELGEGEVFAMYYNGPISTILIFYISSPPSSPIAKIRKTTVVWPNGSYP
jgi:hypothetical protein